MYIAWDPPLALYIANLLTDSIGGYQPGSYIAQGYYCVAALSLEPAINNHPATRPGLLQYSCILWSLMEPLSDLK